MNGPPRGGVIGLISSFIDGSGAGIPREAWFYLVVAERNPWNMDFRVFQWLANDFRTARNAIESVRVFGQVGATTTLSAALAQVPGSPVDSKQEGRAAGAPEAEGVCPSGAAFPIAEFQTKKGNG